MIISHSMAQQGKAWIIGASTVLALVLGALLALWRPGMGQAAAEPARLAAAAPTPRQASIKALSGPWVVALQPGHWEIGDLPLELIRLRRNTGAQWGSIHEVEINTAVVGALAPMLREKGFKVEVVPATVPPSLRADAFVAIHADASVDTSRRGWKLAPPFRASPASRALARALAGAFAAEPALVQDVDGVTVNMRGYFAFNNRRFDHAISPYTPAAIIELGFLSNSSDRALLTGDPGYWAGIITRGLTAYFGGRSRSDTSDLEPLYFDWMAAGAGGAVVRSEPRADAPRTLSLDPGTTVMPVDVSGDWYEVFMRRPYRTGWVAKGELVPAENPRWPMPGERRG